jgi:hypothetical protein
MPYALGPAVAVSSASRSPSSYHQFIIIARLAMAESCYTLIANNEEGDVPTEQELKKTLGLWSL